ncbi:MAG TPA: 2'-5' RNA ligase family protein [Flavobacteriales bacterium]|nr:2'-5' RNA ligase family protein [Flavobacteriales bacterium]HMU13559.1 2'-5' RNA ligase family protein [Flavobacteriales bacterium]HMZ47369.1 2'-5' RNA ligase family protein [Flavobacteriales bacterium]HNE80819.1 2'-5' RNA ligase family protein [Flavobacteriales bacterium]HNI05779.1 2'-5' RNA ligase family protein [Flavobacteriales bacterium]
MLHRFLLTILPATVLAAEVQRLRDLLHPQIGGFSGRNTSPHITLCFLDLPEVHEQAIISAIAHGATGQHAFMLHYNGITHFPDHRTIYIDPVEKDAIASVRTPIIAALKEDVDLRDAIRETDHPHLTIAAGLKPAQFDKAWEMLAPHAVRSEERVTEAVLLKRLLRPGTRYEPVRSFPMP